MPNDGRCLDALGGGFVAVGGWFVCGDISDMDVEMPGWIKYVWWAFGLSLIGVAFGYLCTLSLVIAGFLCLCYGLFLFGVLGLGGDDYYSNYFPGLFLFLTIAFILFQLARVYSLCGCWLE